MNGAAHLGRPLIPGIFVRNRDDVVIALAVDSAHVYWFDARRSSIGRANLDGTHIQRRFIRAAPSTDTIAVDAAHLYWSTNAGIGRANLDGSQVQPLFIRRTRGRDGTGVAVDAEHVYFTNDTGIGRANLDGTGVEQSFVEDGQNPSSVAVDAHHIYVAGRVESFAAIQVSNLDGSGLTDPQQSTALDPVQLTLGAGHLYWNDAVPGYPLVRADLDGTHRRIIVPRPNLGIAVDTLTAPGTRIDTAGITPSRHRARFGFSSPQPGVTFECALDRRPFTRCRSPRTYDRLAPGAHVFRVRSKSRAAVDPSPATRRLRT